MKHDLNNSPSYEHLQGKEQKSHLGSQSKHPAPPKSMSYAPMGGGKAKTVKDTDYDSE